MARSAHRSHGNLIAIGPSEQAQINIIAGQIDRLPQQPQMIFTWTPDRV